MSHFPENVQLLTSLGLLYLQNDHFHKSFELLGKSLTFDPENFKVRFNDEDLFEDHFYLQAILAAGSLMQQHGDFDVALSKYRIAAKSSPQNSSLWNNIAMCFFGKKKLVAVRSSSSFDPHLRLIFIFVWSSFSPDLHLYLISIWFSPNFYLISINRLSAVWNELTICLLSIGESYTTWVFFIWTCNNMRVHFSLRVPPSNSIEIMRACIFYWQVSWWWCD